MSGQGWYDADGQFHEGPPPQPKQAAPVTPEPSGWYDADGNFHEGLPPGLAAKRAEEERLAAEAAASRQAEEARIEAEAAARPEGWYDAHGDYHEGLPPGLAKPAADAHTVPAVQAQPAAQPQVVVVQPAAVAPAAPILVAAPQRASGGAKAALVVLSLGLVASLAALAMALLGIFSLGTLGLGGIGLSAAAPVQQLSLVPAGQVGYSSWRAKPVSETNATPPEALAKAVSGPASTEPLTTTVAAVSGDRADSFGVTNQSCDFTTLRAQFSENTTLGETWVAALNLDETLGWGSGLKTADLKAFTDNLTPLVLLADTLVTMHGQVPGASFPTQSVLQAGTIVGVDRYGVPRVRCVSGEPLTVAVPLEGDSVQFTGQQWQGFDAAKIVSFTPASAAMGSFDVRFVGAANVEGGAIAVGWRLCDRDDCPAPGPDAKAPDASDPPAGTVIPAAPAQCPALNDQKTVAVKFYNLSDTPVVISWVDPATCQTFIDNGWSELVGPGQLLRGEASEGQIVQIGNGTDTTPIDSLTVSEGFVYGIG